MTLPLYQRVLGDAWSSLPPLLQAMHDFQGDLVAEGKAVIDRGPGLLARLAAALFRFPDAGRDVPVRVEFARRAGGERWRRTFAGRSFESVQGEGRGLFDGLIAESFGPFTFGLALVLGEGRLRLVLRGWSVLGVSLPVAWAPRGDACEFVGDGRFNFHVEIGHPLTGLIVRYRGWLVPRPAGRAS